ncbi:MBL fold metallo-hydrolase [uncultured Alsobacter sp.]|uniref:MBL fold metallo-hydrolase n=1 Tax=uncultured Alsobacter sp. TaxID=1748258 RepID=UPI0025F42A4D|nr:MBL fold metallo-hydrolase [uncultured Alsobacter sp.]
MSEPIPFDTTFDDPPGELRALSPLVRRMVAGNKSPFTFTGTCTYVVGRGDVAVIDPGPADQRHIDTLAAALAGERVSAIVVTHTHRDHSPGARLLSALTGAPIVGCGPHVSFRPRWDEEAPGLDAAGDREHAPARILAEGDSVEGDGWSLVAVDTPGHSANHLAFALPQERALFSGDHVMAWSTTIVAPPDGAMAPYMASLQKLMDRDDVVYWPGHGGPVTQPNRFVRALMGHRRQREASILDRIKAGDETIPAIVERIYEGLSPALRGAAALSVFAHIEDLVGRGAVVCEGPPLLDTRYRAA